MQTKYIIIITLLFAVVNTMHGNAQITNVPKTEQQSIVAQTAIPAHYIARNKWEYRVHREINTLMLLPLIGLFSLRVLDQLANDRTEDTVILAPFLTLLLGLAGRNQNEFFKTFGTHTHTTSTNKMYINGITYGTEKITCGMLCVWGLLLCNVPELRIEKVPYPERNAPLAFKMSLFTAGIYGLYEIADGTYMVLTSLYKKFMNSNIKEQA